MELADALVMFQDSDNSEVPLGRLKQVIIRLSESHQVFVRSCNGLETFCSGRTLPATLSEGAPVNFLAVEIV